MVDIKFYVLVSNKLISIVYVNNHLNRLRLGNHLLMPMYGCPEDEMAVNVIKKELPDINVIKVDSKEIYRLAERGGVLNCISWQIP